MKRFLTTLLLVIIAICSVSAQQTANQTALKKVYNEDLNQMTQIDSALNVAKKEGKNVICQVGGNWCPWCLRFAAFATDNAEVSKAIAADYVYIHVNYSRKSSQDAARAAVTKQMLQRLNNPQRFGFPVFVVLADDGSVLHIQDSSFLEEGEGYSQEKTLRFLGAWTPKACRGEK